MRQSKVCVYFFLLCLLLFIDYRNSYAQRRQVAPQDWIPFIEQEREPATPVKKAGVLWMDPNGTLSFKNYRDVIHRLAGQYISYTDIYELAIDGNIIYVDGLNHSVGFFTNTPSSSAYIQLSDNFVICKTKTSAGVQACINILPVTGGTVFLPEGTYDWDNEVTKSASYDYIQIIGSGWGTILDPDTAWQGGSYGNFITLYGDGCIIKDLKIKGDKTGTSHDPSYRYLELGDRGKIENVWFYQCEGASYGIATVGAFGEISRCLFEQCGEDSGCLLSPWSADNCNIHDNIFYGNSAVGIYSWSADNWTIHDNLFYSENYDSCITITWANRFHVSDNLMYDIVRGIEFTLNTSYVSNSDIVNNIIVGADTYGIIVYGENINVEDNYVYDTDPNGIDIYIGADILAYNINISDNYLSGVQTGDKIYAGKCGIYVYDADVPYTEVQNIRISDNFIGYHKIYGIYARYVNDLQINNNVIKAQGILGNSFYTNAIYIDSTCTNVSLWGNDIYDPNNVAPIINNASSNKAFETVDFKITGNYVGDSINVVTYEGEVVTYEEDIVFYY